MIDTKILDLYQEMKYYFKRSFKIMKSATYKGNELTLNYHDGSKDCYKRMFGKWRKYPLFLEVDKSTAEKLDQIVYELENPVR